MIEDSEQNTHSAMLGHIPAAAITREQSRIAIAATVLSARVPSRLSVRVRAWARMFWVQAAACMAVAGVIRIAFLIRAQGMFDGDEGVLGIQAEQILRGAHPTYAIGVDYLGTIEAYLAAPWVALLGPTAWALRIPPLVESLLLIPVTGALAERLYGRRARLPALVLAALPSLYVAVGDLRFLGGYIETFLFGALAMLLVVAIFDRLRQGQRVLWQMAALGLVVGLAFWTYTLFLEYMAAIGLWALPLAIWRLRLAIASHKPIVRGIGLGALAGVGGLLVGYSPAIVYGLRNNFSNFAWILQLVLGGDPAYNGGVPQAANPLRVGALHYLLTRALPRLTGSYPLWSLAPSPSQLQHIGLAFLAAAVLHSLVRLAQRIPVPGRGAAVPASFEQTWKLVLAPLLLLVVSVMYWRSSFSDGYVFNFDRTGRYMLPAGTAITVVLAYLFADLPAICGRLIAAVRLRALTSTPPATTGRASRAAAAISLALFGVLLAFNLVQYATADAVQAMQTPYRQGDLFPVVDGDIVTYLEQHHIRYIWGNHWFDYVAMYLSDGQITAADYIGRERMLENTDALERAARPTYVIEADPSQGECATARLLDQMHVTYTAVPFQHYWLITPLSRNVQPWELRPTLPIRY